LRAQRSSSGRIVGSPPESTAIVYPRRLARLIFQSMRSALSSM
jgi:hypothetical protein